VLVVLALPPQRFHPARLETHRLSVTPTLESAVVVAEVTLQRVWLDRQVVAVALTEARVVHQLFPFKVLLVVVEQQALAAEEVGLVPLAQPVPLVRLLAVTVVMV
jgi:hypothetical protein